MRDGDGARSVAPLSRRGRAGERGCGRPEGGGAGSDEHRSRALCGGRLGEGARAAGDVREKRESMVEGERGGEGWERRLVWARKENEKVREVCGRGRG